MCVVLVSCITFLESKNKMEEMTQRKGLALKVQVLSLFSILLSRLDPRDRKLSREGFGKVKSGKREDIDQSKIR